MNQSEQVAKILLDKKAVFLRPQEPFTWTSGIKSPVYCDNRLLISHPEARDIILNGFCEKIQKLNVDMIAGTATAGIPWAAWIAMKLNLPLVYVRSSNKEHGRLNAIEGEFQQGATTVLIEDLISTGKSSIAAAQKLVDAGIEVKSIMSIFSYDFPEVRGFFSKAKFECTYLSTFEVLAQVAYDNHILDKETLKQVLEWRQNVKIS